MSRDVIREVKSLCAAVVRWTVYWLPFIRQNVAADDVPQITCPACPMLLLRMRGKGVKRVGQFGAPHNSA